MSTSSATLPTTLSQPIIEPIPTAPWWHTTTVIAVLFAGSVASFYERGLPNFNLPHLSTNLSGYLTVLAEEWFLALFIWLWLKRTGLSFSTLTSPRWRTPRSALRDLGLGLAFLLVGIPLTSGLAILFKVASVQLNIFPHTLFEIAVYVLLALTAGFCEELIFRGYLLQQFKSRTNNLTAGILLQAIVFGLAHGYQGPRLMLVIAIYGCLFGAFVTWRKSLLPAMIAHGTEDMLPGLIAFFFHLK